MFRIGWHGVVEHLRKGTGPSSGSRPSRPDLSPALVEELAATIPTWQPYDQYERGLLSTESFFSEFRHRFKLNEFEHDEVLAAWLGLIEAPLPGVDALLSEMKGLTALHALSNTNPAHLEKVLHGHSVMAHFDRVFTSVGLGLRKPELEIYRRVAVSLGLPPEQILFVDDLPANVEGARQAGMQAEQCLNSVGRLRGIFARYLAG